MKTGVVAVIGLGLVFAISVAAAPRSLYDAGQNKEGSGDQKKVRPFQNGAGPIVGNVEPGQDESPLKRGPLPGSDEEKRILNVLDEMDRNERRGMMNVPKEDGRLLRVLAESIGAQQVVEVGTSNGYSTIWLCLALRSTGGKVTTFEYDAHRAGLARQNFKRAGVEGLVTLVEGDAHVEVTKLTEPIDLVFLDADKPGYLDYLNKLLPLVRPGGLIVAHNMVSPAPDPAFVEAITTNPGLETIFLNMDAAGVGVSLKKR